MASSGSLPVRGFHQFRPETLRGGLQITLSPLAPETDDLTESRLDDVGLPAIRHELLGAPDAGTPYELVSSAVTVAVRSMEALQQTMRDTAEAFRRCDAAEANRRLVGLATGLRLLTTLADVAARAAGLDLTDLNGRSDAQGPLDAMGAALDQLSSQQFAEDYDGVAETLAERVSPALAGWREVFAEILVHADFRFQERHACS